LIVGRRYTFKVASRARAIPLSGVFRQTLTLILGGGLMGAGSLTFLAGMNPVCHGLLVFKHQLDAQLLGIKASEKIGTAVQNESRRPAIGLILDMVNKRFFRDRWYETAQ
jgi:hypothetical protein